VVYPDLLTASGQAALAALALLLLADPGTQAHRAISASMTLALTIVSAGLFMLSAPLSGALAAVCAAAWWGIFVFRGGRGGLR